MISNETYAYRIDQITNKRLFIFTNMDTINLTALLYHKSFCFTVIKLENNKSKYNSKHCFEEVVIHSQNLFGSHICPVQHFTDIFSTDEQHLMRQMWEIYTSFYQQTENKRLSKTFWWSKNQKIPKTPQWNQVQR